MHTRLDEVPLRETAGAPTNAPGSAAAPALQHPSQDESDKDRVIELAGDRDEVGEDVERHPEVDGQTTE
jgi:hypothetical protein